MHRTLELILVYEGKIKMRVEKDEYELKEVTGGKLDNILPKGNDDSDK